MFSGSPNFLRSRAGRKNGKIFKLIKFRTMRPVCATGKLENDDKYRLTRFGKFLRSTSLDELPELINVLLGDMSLVGPRPLLPEYLPIYSKFQHRRHEVLPGITGWAQVNGRNQISWEKKFELDIWYVDNQNTFLDIYILIKTVWKILKREGISADGEVTIGRFSKKLVLMSLKISELGLPDICCAQVNLGD